MGLLATRPTRIAAAVAAGTVLFSGTGLVAADAHRSSRWDLKAHLTGAKEVPGPGDPNGRGTAKLDLKRDRICFSVSWRRIGAPTAAHIHRGDRDTAGPVVVLLLEAPGGVGGPVRRVSGCADVDRDLVRAIRHDPREYYVNVHNATYPGGAIRGQLHR